MENIPKKFAKFGKSFIKNLGPEAGKEGLSSFCVFPLSVDFNGKDADESIVLLVRRDLATYIPQYLLFVLFLIAPFIFFSVLRGLDINDSSVISFGLGGTVLFLLLAFTVFVDTFVKWFYSVNIVTDKRIVDVDFSNVLYHRYTDTTLDNVEDATHDVPGLLGAFFDYGTVYIQTAGTNPEIEFDVVPRPRDVQDVLRDLIFLKKKGEI